jgi:hypothetical protein
MISKIFILLSLITSASANTGITDLEGVESVKIFNGDTIKPQVIQRINFSEEKITYIELKDGLIIDSTDIREIKFDRLNNLDRLINIHSLKVRGDGSGG